MSLAGKPLSHYRPRPRQPPPSSARMRAIVRPPLWEFVLLSMLVHATVILMFGAPSGGSREGRAMWGALQVVLQGAPIDAGPSLKIDRGLGVDRAEIAKKAPAPRVVPEVRRVEPVVLPPMDAPVDLPPKELPPVVIPPLLDRIVTPDRTPELAPFRMPPPTPAQAAPLPVPAPVVQPAPPPVSLPERVVIPHTEIAPVASPVIPALPTLPTLPAMPAMPPVQRPPMEVPALPAPTTEIAPTQQVPLATPPGPAPAPQLPQQREAPARVDRVPLAREAPGLPSAPFQPSGPSIDSPGAGTGQPATKLDPSAPTLDLDAMRARAGELARSGAGNRAVLPFPMPPVPPKKSKMETAIENARKPDCRTAYAQLGLAAVVPLIANEFGEGNCRW